MKPLRRLSLLLPAILVSGAALGQGVGGSYYQQQRGMDERFRLDVGGFFQEFTTTLSLSNAAGTVGTEVNFEDDLGQDARQTNVRVDGYWRFGLHGRLDFGYRAWNRSNSHSISRDITWGDATYRAGATVDTKLRVSVAEMYYAYSFINNGDLELGAGLGFSTYFTAAEISGTATVSSSGGSQSVSGTTSGRSLVAPIPALKAYFNYALYPRLFASGSFHGITGTIDSYHASMVDWRAGLDWVFSKNFGAGATYNYVKIEFSHAGEAADIAFTYRYQGPFAYLIVAF